MEINSRTRLIILIGDPVEHSVSPEIHNSAFKALGLNYAYLACRVRNLKDAVQGIIGLGIKGASVTIPHKQKIIPLLDTLDPLAQKIGAVNTVLNDNGRLIGYNTDGEAAYLSLLENGAKLPGKKIVILGAGGAARAISFSIATKKQAGEMVILDVTNRRAQSLAKEVSLKTKFPARSARMAGKNLARELKNADVLINASPVGMHPNLRQSPVSGNLIHPGLCVFDIVYNPPATMLLRYAKKAGAKTIPGLQMLVRQAGEQLRLWTGKNPPLEIMFQAGRRALSSKAR
jgi:shikimate dehydrogenase